MALHRLQHALGDAGEALGLVGSDFPRAGLEVHGVDVDPRHARTQRLVVADLVERVAAIDHLDRRRGERRVDLRRGRDRGLADVELRRNPHHRRAEVERDTETEAAETDGKSGRRDRNGRSADDHRRSADHDRRRDDHGVVDDDDLAAE